MKNNRDQKIYNAIAGVIDEARIESMNQFNSLLEREQVNKIDVILYDLYEKVFKAVKEVK